MSKSMLIVADERATTRWLPGYCSARGFKVQTASTASEAIALLGSGFKPDVGLVDAVLGAEDGYVLCQDIRALQPSAYLVMTSARAGHVARLKARAAGADAYLSKPFALDDLADLIETREVQSWD